MKVAETDGSAQSSATLFWERFYMTELSEPDSLVSDTFLLRGEADIHHNLLFKTTLHLSEIELLRQILLFH